VLPTGSPDDKYYLIVGSLALQPGPYPISIHTETASGPASIPVVNPTPDADWISRIHARHASLERARRARQAAPEYPPAQEPLGQRKFYLFVKDRGFQNPENYITVTAELRGVGRYCQVYVDRDDLTPPHPVPPPQGGRAAVGLQPTVDDIVATFDKEVYPWARQLLGQAVDVDRDGRFTILLTGWLAKLANGRVSLGGFVRGSDFFRDLAPPFGNRCDMMYLNTDLKPGPHLHTILAHEYTHAVIFSEHVFGSYLPEGPRQDEEGWLNEALAHLVEDRHGYSWSNLDYRISAFLSAPERYQLVVRDYYDSGLFRSHGNRGATYLFLRWCCDRFGDDLMRQLIQSNLAGLPNLETATEQPFAELFRQWTVALALSDKDPSPTPRGPGLGIDFHGPLGGRLLCGPRFDQVPLAKGASEIKLAGTSAAYLFLHSPEAQFSRVVITAEPGTEFQVTLVRLPEQTARLSLGLEAEGLPAAKNVRLILTAHDQDVILEDAAWERLVPAANRPEDTSYQTASERPRPAGKGIPDPVISTWFGDPHLRAGEARTSSVISLPTGDSTATWIFKIAGTDAAGHHVSAWAVK
jgi:hypothetical protein